MELSKNTDRDQPLIKSIPLIDVNGDGTIVKFSPVFEARLARTL